MIWVYKVAESNRLQAIDASGLSELQALSEEADWLWVDFMEPDDEELEVIAELLEDAEVIRDIKKRRVFSRHERISDYLLVSIPLAVLGDELEIFPLYVFMKEKMLLTVRSKYSSKSVKNALKTFEDCVGTVCEGATNSSFILSRLFHEISNENLDLVIALRESIDEIERKALANPGDKKIVHSVFAVKREICALERTLWSQSELMSSIREGIVLMIETSEEIVATLNHAINNISRELSFLNSYNNALDSILSLQDLGMIHRVERNLIYLTLIALIVSVILILLEIDIINILSK